MTLKIKSQLSPYALFTYILFTFTWPSWWHTRARESVVWILAGARHFLFSKTCRVVLGPTQHPTWWVSQGPKQVGREVNHSSPSRAQVKNKCSYTYAFIAWTGIHYLHYYWLVKTRQNQIMFSTQTPWYNEYLAGKVKKDILKYIWTISHLCNYKKRTYAWLKFMSHSD